MIDDVSCSNGTGWSPDGRTMYHTQSFRYAIHAYDFDAETGAIANQRPFVTLPPDGGGFPDGLTVDEHGFVWSAQPVYGRIVRYDPDGGIDRIISLPVSRGTSCTFGGPDLATLFITSATETLSETQLAEEPLAGNVLACIPGVRGIARITLRWLSFRVPPRPEAQPGGLLPTPRSRGTFPSVVPVPWRETVPHRGGVP